MKIAIIGSRTINIDISEHVPAGVTCIITGGAVGVDATAAEYAQRHGLSLVEIRPNYQIHGKSAPLVRNWELIAQADMVLAVWDGQSRGTAHGINCARKQKKPIKIIKIENPNKKTEQQTLF